jgi:transmembrane sensor
LGKAVVGLAGAVASATIYVVVATDINSTKDYKTALGERSVVTLVDGSKVSLDSGSEVKIGYTRDARSLQLLSGQARFDVAHDTSRPFSVHARDETVIATGTAFNVDLVGSKVLVTLIQGRVTVVRGEQAKPFEVIRRPGTARTTSIALIAGQQLVVDSTSPPRVESAKIDRTTAWESGQLVFDDEPLAVVVERVSRYAPHPVSVDPSAATLRISGVFNAGDVSTFVDTVVRYLPVQATDAPDGAITLRRRS